jgi:hypothetical protein
VHAQLQLGAWRHIHRIARIYGITDLELPALSTGLGRTLVETVYHDRSIPGHPEGWDRKKTQETGRNGGYDCSSSHEAIPPKTLSQSCRLFRCMADNGRSTVPEPSSHGDEKTGLPMLSGTR